MEELNKNPKIEVNTNNVAKILKKQLRDYHSICIVPQLSQHPTQATQVRGKRNVNVKSKQL